MRRLVVTSVLGSMLVVPLVGLAGPASAASTLVVGQTSASCPDPLTSSIAAAVFVAHPGDTIQVCSGTYLEGIDDQGKDLSFVGAKAGVDGRTRSTTATDESSITGVGPVVHLTGGSSVDGFQIVVTSGGSGVGAELDADGSLFADNVLTGSSTAVQILGSSEIVRHNQIVLSDGSTSSPATAGGRGVEADNGHGATLLVDGNAFSGDLTRGAVAIGQTAGSPVVDGVSAADNSAELGGTGTFLSAAETTNLAVTGNTINGAHGTSFTSSGVTLSGGDSGFAISGNRIVGPFYGIQESGTNDGGAITGNDVRNAALGVSVDGPSGALGVHSNIFTGSSTEAVASQGGNPDTVQAQNNFFGCNDGPTGLNGCDGVPASGVVATPYLVLTSSIATHSAQLNQAVGFTATLQRNSGGQHVALPVLDGEPITFTYDHGSVTPPSATLTAGSATTTVRPTSTGSGTVTATVDNATSSQALNSTPIRPQIRISDAGTAEGNSGTHALVFRVTLNRRSSVPVTVRYTTANSSATAPSDYVAKSGTVTFPAGATSRTISVSVRGDRTHEANETFAVNIFGPTNATVADPVGIGVIRNDD
jgi:hypothetical protein